LKKSLTLGEVMNEIVQVLARLKNPKSAKVQQVIPATASTLNSCELYVAMSCSSERVGCDVLMATEYGDTEAIKRLWDEIEMQLGSDTKGREMSFIVLSELNLLPLGKVKKKRQSLLKRYGDRANCSRRLVAQRERAIKSLERSGRYSESIAKYREDIKRERESLSDFAESHAGLSCLCPRCGGVGAVRGSCCDPCGGAGRFSNTFKDWEYHLKKSGASCSLGDIAKIQDVVVYFNEAKMAAIADMEKKARLERVD
jgi:uncharacterized phage protein